MPLLTRIPCSDWMPPNTNNWDIIQAITLSLALSDVGVDFLDVSSAALVAVQKVASGPRYQFPFPEAIKKAFVEAGKAEKTKAVLWA
jgi:hypothetical protein